MKFLVLAIVLGVAAATHKHPLSVISIFGVSPSELAKERVRNTEICSEEGCRKVVVPFSGVITQRVLGLRDIFEKPIFVLASTTEHPEGLTAYYAHNGIRSIKDVESFKGLNEYLKTPSDLVGLVFYPKGVYSPRLFETSLERTVLPNNFKVTDFLKTLSQSQEIPILLVDTKVKFDNLHISAVSEVARFGIYDDIIEPLTESVIAPSIKGAPAQVAAAVPVNAPVAEIPTPVDVPAQ